MRTFIFGTLFIFVTGMLSGCGSSKETKPAPPAAPQAEKASPEAEKAAPEAEKAAPEAEKAAPEAEKAAPKEEKVAPQAAKGAETKDFVMQSGGTDVLKLTAPAGTESVAKDGSLKLDTPKYIAEVWLVGGAKTVDEAMGKVGSQIVSEFKNFKPNQTTDLTVAGSPAKRMVGAGEEADDGDPGNADVIVFKVGDHVFVGCYHGESLADEGQQGLLALVQTARVP